MSAATRTRNISAGTVTLALLLVAAPSYAQDRIDFDDFMMFAASYGAAPGDPGYSAMFNFTANAGLIPRLCTEVIYAGSTNGVSPSSFSWTPAKPRMFLLGFNVSGSFPALPNSWNSHEVMVWFVGPDSSTITFKGKLYPSNSSNCFVRLDPQEHGLNLGWDVGMTKTTASNMCVTAQSAVVPNVVVTAVYLGFES